MHPFSWANYLHAVFHQKLSLHPNFGLKIKFLLRFAPPPRFQIPYIGAFFKSLLKMSSAEKKHPEKDAQGLGHADLDVLRMLLFSSANEFYSIDSNLTFEIGEI